MNTYQRNELLRAAKHVKDVLKPLKTYGTSADVAQLEEVERILLEQTKEKK